MFAKPGWWLVLAVLLASIPSYRTIPFGRYWGWDLDNLEVFHRCTAPAADGRGLARNQPYRVAGEACGDSVARPMVYPPLLYWSFAWLRAMPLREAIRLWALAILTGMACLPLLWTLREERKWPGWLFWLLLLAQFPVAFSIERGNVDVVPVLLWSLAFAAFRAQQDFSAGLLAGLAVAAKLYPVVGCAVVLMGVAGSVRREARFLRRALALTAGLSIAILVGCLPFLQQGSDYFLRVLPSFAREIPPSYVYSHSLPSVVGNARWLAVGIDGMLLGCWGVAASRCLHRQPALIFAGALAISTYFAGTSYDYNLITVYPLLLLQFLAASDDGRAFDWGLLILGLISVVGNRVWFSDVRLYSLHVGLQIAWLLISAGATALRAPTLDARET